MTLHPATWWVVLLLPLSLAALLARRRGRRALVGFSSLEAVRHAPKGRWTRAHRLLPWLRLVSIGLLILCAARPVIPNESTRTLVEGVAIELVIDRSDSMRALDFTVGDKTANRLEALKDMAARFIAGGDGFEGRPNDLVGVLMFARNADSVVPLTLDHDVVLDAIGQIRFPDDGAEMGTAIGDAIALGVDKLKDAADRANSDGQRRIKSKVLVLFTDGESNSGELSPDESALLAASTGVRVYTVGLGTQGYANVPIRTPFGTQMQRVPVSIDEETLTRIAEETGGRYFRATDSDSLRTIYETIDGLEKSRIEESRQTRYRDLAVQDFTLPIPLLGRVRMPPILVAAIMVLFLEILLASTRARSLA